MYQIQTTKDFEKAFKKLDSSIQRVISSWIKKHLLNCIDPRVQGKGLTANLKGYWRYRIGNYRLIVEIQDDKLTIVAIMIAHRSEIYKGRTKKTKN